MLPGRVCLGHHYAGNCFKAMWMRYPGWEPAEFCGTTSQQRLARSKQVALEEGYIEIPPYDHYDVIAGQGTIGKEILEQVPDVDIVLVLIGGGGYLGHINLIKNIKPRVQVIGVEPENSTPCGIHYTRRDYPA